MTGVDPTVLGESIVRARREGRLLAAPGEHGLSAQDAYAVQAQVLAPRMRSGGGRGGWKLGYTSAVMREQMGITEPNYGPVARGMLLSDRGDVRIGVTQPRVEPEIAAVMGCATPVGASVAEVRSAVSEWRIALEVVDSVWQDYRFDWALNTADGSSAAFVVVGDLIAHGGDEDVATLEVDLLIDGEVVAQGRGEAAMGDPVLALHWLAQREPLTAGEVVITGGLTAARPFEVGHEAGARARRGTDILGSVSATRQSWTGRPR